MKDTKEVFVKIITDHCVCLVSCLYYLPFIAVAIAAGFMALIVRIIKNIFQQAIDMKAELDLTI